MSKRLTWTLALCLALGLAGCYDDDDGIDEAQDDGPQGGNANDGDEVNPGAGSGGASPEEMDEVTGDDPARY